MPLIKGAKPNSKGFKQNIEAEISAGKPQKQAVAIAYSESKQHKGKTVKKEMEHHKKAAHHMKEAAKHHEKAKEHMDHMKMKEKMEKMSKMKGHMDEKQDKKMMKKMIKKDCYK